MESTGTPARKIGEKKSLYKDKYAKTKVFVIIILIFSASITITASSQIRKLNLNETSSFNFNEISERDSWWNDDWNHYKMITIESGYIEEGLKNFPILINSTNSTLINKCDEGNSIRFTSLDNNTEFFYEIEEWTESGFSIWVNISETIQTDSNYKFLMYYNNSNANDNQNPLNVWDSDYLTVQHFEEVYSTDSEHFKDSSKGYHNGTLFDENNRVIMKPAKIGQGIKFSGNDEAIELENTNCNNITLMAWFNTDDDWKENDGIVARYYNADGLRTGTPSTKRTSLNVNGTSYTQYENEYINNSWYFMVLTYDWEIIKTYYNDSKIEIDTPPGGGDLDYSQFYWGIGASSTWTSGQFTNYWNGTIDEVRISKIARNSSWIKACFNNQNQTPGFLTFGPEITKPVDNIPPTVEITYPEEGQEVSGIITITGNSEDPDGTVEYVEVKIDEESWEEATGSTTWTKEWNTTEYSDGAHTIHARSYDGEDYSNIYTVNVTINIGGKNIPPTVEIIYPEEGQEVSGTIAIYGKANDSDGNVTLVEVRIDQENWETAAGNDTWTISWETKNYTNGDHKIHARSFDGEDYSNIYTVNVTIYNSDGNIPPIVEITNPEEGQNVSGIINIFGISYDPDGDVEFVQVKIDDYLWNDAYGTDLWTYEWNTTNYTEGTHSIFARCYDGENYSKIDIVNVTVEKGIDNIPPTIIILTPELEKIYLRLFNYTFKIPFPFVTNPLILGKLLVEVNVQDNVGIESVRYYIDNIYKETTTTPPYSWMWSEISDFLILYDLKVVARDTSGNEATDIIQAWKIQIYE